MPMTVSWTAHARLIQSADAHQPTRTNHTPRTYQATCGRPASETTLRPSASCPRTHVRLRGRSVRIDGSRLMIQIPSGMPMIVASANHATPTAIPDAHHPTKSHQTKRTRRPGPRVPSTVTTIQSPNADSYSHDPTGADGQGRTVKQ